MPENRRYLPEGFRRCGECTLLTLQNAMENQDILDGIPLLCDSDHALHFRFGGVSALMPREDVIAPWISGADRHISAISRVGKSTCFTVKSVISDEKGAPKALLSRREAQEQAMEWFLQNLRRGAVITGRILRLESYGAFVDIGCGIVGLLPIERISTSRLNHPRERFAPGEKILAVIWEIDPQRRRITLTHRELLGTWMENASAFCAGETVQGTVRSIKPYGIFVELTPNLSGLAEPREGLCVGDRVSVYLKNIRPDNMKIKLQIVDRLEPADEATPLRYQITDGVLDRWVYSPTDCLKPPILTDFTACDS